MVGKPGLEADGGILTMEARPGGRQGPERGQNGMRKGSCKKASCWGLPPSWAKTEGSVDPRAFQGFQQGSAAPVAGGGGGSWSPRLGFSSRKTGEPWWGLSCFPPSAPILCHFIKRVSSSPGGRRPRLLLHIWVFLNAWHVLIIDTP